MVIIISQNQTSPCEISIYMFFFLFLPDCEKLEQRFDNFYDLYLLGLKLLNCKNETESYQFLLKSKERNVKIKASWKPTSCFLGICVYTLIFFAIVKAGKDLSHIFSYHNNLKKYQMKVTVTGQFVSILFTEKTLTSQDMGNDEYLANSRDYTIASVNLFKGLTDLSTQKKISYYRNIFFFFVLISTEMGNSTKYLC